MILDSLKYCLIEFKRNGCWVFLFYWDFINKLFWSLILSEIMNYGYEVVFF